MSEDFYAAATYLEDRKFGRVKSIKTPWKNFNDVGMKGIEWHTMLVIGARPGVGKTLIADLITTNAPALNSDQDFMICKLQFEMLGRNTAIRELSGAIGKSIKYLNSADEDLGDLTATDLSFVKKYAEMTKTRQEYVVDTPSTPKGIGKTLRNFYKEFKKPFIVTLDHSMLVEKAADEKDKVEMLQNLGKELTAVKRELPCIIIILSQLNRSVDAPERQEKPSQANYPNDGDLFGGDALFQHADIMCLVNKPSKYGLEYYGGEMFEVTDKNLLAFHFTKVRSGNTRISFFLGEFEKMQIREVAPPPRKSKSSSTTGKFTPRS